MKGWVSALSSSMASQKGEVDGDTNASIPKNPKSKKKKNGRSPNHNTRTAPQPSLKVPCYYHHLLKCRVFPKSFGEERSFPLLQDLGESFPFSFNDLAGKLSLIFISITQSSSSHLSNLLHGENLLGFFSFVLILKGIDSVEAILLGTPTWCREAYRFGHILKN
jgi:hypothetical protein